jgi:Ca2+/Na+ antiporter
MLSPENRNYTFLILFSVLVSIVLFFIDSDIRNFAPIAFWATALLFILNYGYIIIRTSNDIKKSNPELYKKYAVGFMLTRNALSDESFLNQINEDEKKNLGKLKVIFRYLFVCFLLFAASSILTIIV